MGGAAAGGRTPGLQTLPGTPRAHETQGLRRRTPDPGRRHSEAAIAPPQFRGGVLSRACAQPRRTASPQPTPARSASPGPIPQIFRVGEGAPLGESRRWRPPACGELADSLLVSKSFSSLLQLSDWRQALKEARRPELAGKAAVAEAAARPEATAGGKAAPQGECDKPPPPPPSSRVHAERGRPRGPARPQTPPSGQHPDQARQRSCAAAPCRSP